MKKRMTAWCCLLALLFCLLPLQSQAATYYFVALNDDILEPSLQTTPISINGVLYIPCTIFDRRASADYFGAWYERDTTTNAVIVRTTDYNIVFAINAGTAFVYENGRLDEGVEYSQRRVVFQNNIPYVPFEFTATNLRITYGIGETSNAQVLRLKNGAEFFEDDTFFVNTKSYELDAYIRDLTASNPNPNDNQPPEDVTPDLPTEAEVLGRAVLYFAIQVEQGDRVSGILNAMNDNGQAKGIFFFSPDNLIVHDDILREIIGTGHRIGLIPQGDTIEEQMESLQLGNELLEHIVRQRAVFVLGEGLGMEAWEALDENGYLPWSSNVAPSGQEGSGTELAQNVIQRISGRTGKVRVLLSDSVSSGTVSSILRQLRSDQYEFRTARETNY